MKTKLLIILSVIVSCTQAFGYEVKIDGICYNLDHQKQTAEVTYSDYYNQVYNSNWKILNITIPSSIDYNGSIYKVTSIGDHAFENCTILKTAQLPNTIKKIGKGAFNGCWVLNTITIPDSVESIGNSAFMNCHYFTSIEIPNSVTSLGNHVFYNCYHLSSIKLGDNVTKIKESSFTLCSSLRTILLSGAIKTIEDYAFWKCSNLTSIDIPNNVEYISTLAFKECDKLTTVTINSDSILKTFVNNIFGEQVTNYIIGNDVTEIGEFAFQGCPALSSIIIPKNVLTIGYGALSSCTSLREISVDTANPNYSSLDGVLFNKEQTYLIQYPIGKENSSYSLPHGVSHIVGGAFKECANIVSITFNNGLIDIDDEAFYKCEGLKSIVIPNSVTNIGWASFCKCYNMESIILGTGIAHIGSFAFSYIQSLTSITCKAANPPILKTDVFYDVTQSACPLYVPSGTEQHYKATDQWKEFNPILPIGDAIEDVYVEGDKSVKVLHDGQIYILRGEKIYTLQGQEVR